MNEIPLWLSIVVSVLALSGAGLTLLGCLGLARFTSFYERIHAPTLGTSFGCFFVLLASILYFSVSGQRPALHEVLILFFVSITTPVTLMLLARAALYRDRAEKSGEVPASIGQDNVHTGEAVSE